MNIGNNYTSTVINGLDLRNGNHKDQVGKINVVEIKQEMKRLATKTIHFVFFVVTRENKVSYLVQKIRAWMDKFPGQQTI